MERFIMSKKHAKAQGFAARGALLYWAVLLTLGAAVIHSIGLQQQQPRSVLLLLLAFTVVQAVTAVFVVALPTRRLLLAAALVEGAGALFWVIAHSGGLPDGFSTWRPETLGIPDLYLPAMEGASAIFFLYLCGRTWRETPRAWRITLSVWPLLLLFGLLLLVVLNAGIAEVVLAIFFLAGGLPTSLQYFFLPACGLLAALLIARLLWPRLRAMTRGAWRTVLILLPALLVINILTWSGGVSSAATVWFPASEVVSAPAGQTTTLAYCRSIANGSPLAMDLSQPLALAPRPAPVVFFIHGGETFLGSRVLEDGSADSVYFTQLRAELLSRGFAVGSIDYGLVPLYHIGEQVTDAKCAVRFMRAHASALGLDPQRIGVYGPSQGGYISAMLGTAGPAVGYDVGQYLNQSSRVQAVVDMWGPTDLTNFSGSPSWISSIVRGRPAALRKASPVTYVAPGDPPFLIIHGADDWFIAPHHSQELARLLHAAGVPETLVIVQHNGHGLDAPSAGQVEHPSAETLVHMISDFFSRTLPG